MISNSFGLKNLDILVLDDIRIVNSELNKIGISDIGRKANIKHPEFLLFPVIKPRAQQRIKLPHYRQREQEDMCGNRVQ